MRHYSVGLILDDTTDRVVRSIWQRVADAGLSSEMLAIGNPPHVTLGVFDRVDVDGLVARVRTFAAEHRPFELRFASAGTFGGDGGVAFLAPVVTGELLKLHRSFHEAIAGGVSDPWEHYLPGHWVPLCTTGFALPAEHLGRVVAMTRECGLPLVSQAQALVVGSHDPSADTGAQCLERVSLGRGE